MHNTQDEVWTAYRPEENDVFTLNPICFDGNTNDIRAGDYLKINGQHSFIKIHPFSNSEESNVAIVLEHPREYYQVKDVTDILYKFIFRKIKLETIKVKWMHK